MKVMNAQEANRVAGLEVRPELTEEEWDESAAPSIAAVARQLGVSKTWARRTLKQAFGRVDEQSYSMDGQYMMTDGWKLRWLPGRQATWVTKGQAQVLDALRHQSGRRNGLVTRYKATAA